MEHERFEADEWGTEAPSIMSPEKLAAMREALDQSPLVVEHWFYFGARSPDRTIFEEYHVLYDYLLTKTRPGDAIHVWRFDLACRDDNSLTHGKCPDANGLTPKKGSY